MMTFHLNILYTVHNVMFRFPAQKIAVKIPIIGVSDYKAIALILPQCSRILSLSLV